MRRLQINFEATFDSLFRTSIKNAEIIWFQSDYFSVLNRGSKLAVERYFKIDLQPAHCHACSEVNFGEFLV